MNISAKLWSDLMVASEDDSLAIAEQYQRACSEERMRLMFESIDKHVPLTHAESGLCVQLWRHSIECTPKELIKLARGTV